MVWVVFALMTAGVVLCLVWPLAAARPRRGGKAADLDFYKSQLAEVDLDVGRGLVPTTEAETTRTEIGRRLLASAARQERDAPSGGFRTRRLAAVIAAAALLPLLSVGLYLDVGRPDQPDLPVAGRESGSSIDLAGAIAKIEAHLAADPVDGRGFEVIAPIYQRLGRFDDAVRAYSATIRLLGDSAARRSALGQALVMAADGVVTSEAHAAFDKAVALDPGLPQARFFLALAAEQDGDKVKARTLWTQLAADAGPDAPWLPSVRQRLAALDAQTESMSSGALPAPSGPMAAGIAAMAPGERQVAIRGMVDGLATRLAQNGRDPEGWLRLVKAYTVLGDGAKARGALTDARKALADDKSALTRLDDLSRQLGLEG